MNQAFSHISAHCDLAVPLPSFQSSIVLGHVRNSLYAHVFHNTLSRHSISFIAYSSFQIRPTAHGQQYRMRETVMSIVTSIEIVRVEDEDDEPPITEG